MVARGGALPKDLPNCGLHTGAIEHPQRLLPPGMDAGGGEPREPV